MGANAAQLYKRPGEKTTAEQRFHVASILLIVCRQRNGDSKPARHLQVLLSHHGQTLVKNSCCVWITDDGTKTDSNRTSLLYSVYSNGNWAEPVKILENGTTDFYPQIHTVTSGAWLAWQDSDTVFADSEIELSEMMASQEIAVAFYDSATGAWGSQVDLSSNDHLDRSPVLATSGNSALICWVSNEGNDILGFADYANTLMYALYDGGTWSSPAAITTGLGAIVKMDLLYNAANSTGTAGVQPGRQRGYLNRRRSGTLFRELWRFGMGFAGSIDGQQRTGHQSPTRLRQWRRGLIGLVSGRQYYAGQLILSFPMQQRLWRAPHQMEERTSH